MTAYLPPLYVWWIVGGLCALLLAWMLGRAVVAAVRAAWNASERRPAFEDILTNAVAAIATGVSAQGMWRFTGDVLGMDGPLRALLFAFIELAVLASAVRARRSMRENRAAGIDGIAVWVLACLTAVLSSLDARSPAEAVFRLAAPLVAAWLWERGMAIERHRITGRSRIKWRFTPERAMVRLGLAEAGDRTVTEVDTHRRLTRVALAAKRVHQLRAAGAKPKALGAAVARRDRALDQAVEHTDLATSPATRARLLDIATTLGGGEDLTQVLATAPAPWADDDHPAVTGRPRASEAVMLAAALNLNTAARLRGLPPEAVATGDRSPTTPATGRAPDGDRLVQGVGFPPPSPEGRSWLASLTRWSRPQPRPVAAPGVDHSPVAEPVADAAAEPGADEEAVATGRGTGRDRSRPDEQDKRRAIRFWITRAKKGQPMSKRELAELTGFSETWALGCIQDARTQLIDKGWEFDDKGVPAPPRPVADPVATGGGG
ncbi:hypothetical protein [Sphaerisporangium album]|uniref:hypothetical protein n=1 Tax=Sphaerisporangium album TaxID=509200 RepID=UPI0015F04A17|nr:hypothetical protein [Sphaerisporangium album]